MAENPGLASQDEILQVLFWLRGERLAQDASAAELVRFVSLPLAEVEQVLRRLAALGLVTETRGHGSPAARYRLSEDGIREGGRRFADEFADLTRPGHGECGDPDCECRRTGNTDDCHGRATN